MYMINTHLNGNTSPLYPDDFPMLTNGRTFAMKKQGDDFIIQTTISDNKQLIKLVENGEKEINKRIETGHKEAMRLLDYNSYTFDNLSSEKRSEEAQIMIYGETFYKKLKANKAL